jgi:hypothetical protein
VPAPYSFPKSDGARTAISEGTYQPEEHYNRGSGLKCPGGTFCTPIKKEPGSYRGLAKGLAKGLVWPGSRVEVKVLCAGRGERLGGQISPKKRTVVLAGPSLVIGVIGDPKDQGALIRVDGGHGVRESRSHAARDASFLRERAARRIDKASNFVNSARS